MKKRDNRENPIIKRIAENILLFRKRFNYTQAKLGARLNVDPDTVRSWEACRRRPDEDMIYAMSGFEEVEGGWMWFYQDNNKSEKPAAAAVTQAALAAPSHLTAEEREKWALFNRFLEFERGISTGTASGDDCLTFLNESVPALFIEQAQARLARASQTGTYGRAS